MKKTLIATAIAGAMGFSVAAQAAPTVYGNIQLIVDVENDNTAKNNGSTIGFKGEQQLDNGLVGIYKAEFEFNAGAQKGLYVTTDEDGDVDGASGLTKGDNAYLGVKGNFGTIRVGSFDTIENDLIGDAIYVEEYTGGDFSAFSGDNREWQQIQYSGKFSGVELRASVNMNGKVGSDATPEDKDLDNAMQVGVKADVMEGVAVAVAYDTYESAVGVAATMKMDALSVGVNYETSDNYDSAIAGSVAYNYGFGNVYAIASMFEIDENQDGARTLVGASYNLGEAMYVYTEVVSGDKDSFTNGKADDAKSTVIGAALSF